MKKPAMLLHSSLSKYEVKMHSKKNKMSTIIHFLKKYGKTLFQLKFKGGRHLIHFPSSVFKALAKLARSGRLRHVNLAIEEYDPTNFSNSMQKKSRQLLRAFLFYSRRVTFFKFPQDTNLESLQRFIKYLPRSLVSVFFPTNGYRDLPTFSPLISRAPQLASLQRATYYGALSRSNTRFSHKHSSYYKLILNILKHNASSLEAIDFSEQGSEVTELIALLEKTTRLKSVVFNNFLLRSFTEDQFKQILTILSSTVKTFSFVINEKGCLYHRERFPLAPYDDHFYKLLLPKLESLTITFIKQKECLKFIQNLSTSTNLPLKKLNVCFLYYAEQSNDFSALVEKLPMALEEFTFRFAHPNFQDDKILETLNLLSKKAGLKCNLPSIYTLFVHGGFNKTPEYYQYGYPTWDAVATEFHQQLHDNFLSNLPQNFERIKFGLLDLSFLHERFDFFNKTKAFKMQHLDISACVFNAARGKINPEIFKNISRSVKYLQLVHNKQDNYEQFCSITSNHYAIFGRDDKQSNYNKLCLIQVEPLLTALNNLEKQSPTIQVSVDGENYLPINQLNKRLRDASKLTFTPPLLQPRKPTVLSELLEVMEENSPQSSSFRL